MTDDEIVVSDEHESALIEILAVNLSEQVFLEITKTSKLTNLRISAVALFALSATNWDYLTRIMNEADAELALMEVDEILGDADAEESP